MSKVYVICKTTGYGTFHRPIYLETKYVKAAKMRDELNRLYRKLAMLKHGNLYNSPVASIHEMDLDYYSYPDPRNVAKIYRREPMVLTTDLDWYFRLYSEEEKELAMNNHMENKKDDIYKAEYFEIDYKTVVNEIKKAIEELEEEKDEW